MNTGSSDNFENFTSFNNTNTLSRNEQQEYDSRIDRKFDNSKEYDGFEVINVDYSRDDASAQNPLIIRDDFVMKVIDHSKDDASVKNPLIIRDDFAAKVVDHSKDDASAQNT